MGAIDSLYPECEHNHEHEAQISFVIVSWGAVKMDSQILIFRFSIVMFISVIAFAVYSIEFRSFIK